MFANARSFLFLMPALMVALPASAHFQMLLPHSAIIENPESAEISLDLAFLHPFEQEGMDMERPVEVGVMVEKKKENLSNRLVPSTYLNKKAWRLNYTISHPGDYLFYTVPQPYWESIEQKYIVHFAKTVVSAFGAEEGWDEPIGLPAEIIPLTRPYGIYAGNVFTGQVKIEGKIAAGIPVEVEYLNLDGLAAPAQPFVTQVVKTDSNGIFHWSLPRAGWWGFAALGERAKPLEKDGQMRPVELGAVLWVEVAGMKAAQHSEPQTD